MDRVDRMDGVVGVSRVAMTSLLLCFIQVRFEFKPGGVAAINEGLNKHSSLLFASRLKNFSMLIMDLGPQLALQIMVTRADVT